MKTLLVILLFLPAMGWSKEKSQKPALQPVHNHQVSKQSPRHILVKRNKVRFVKQEQCFFILPFMNMSFMCNAPQKRK